MTYDYLEKLFSERPHAELDCSRTCMSSCKYGHSLRMEKGNFYDAFILLLNADARIASDLTCTDHLRSFETRTRCIV